MNYNYRNHNNLRLISRNEGKIKSYESCTDIRAWSHDIRKRNSYLKEWIKSDMPIRIIPVSTLTNLLRIMTGKSRLKATPKCHPDCKSKVVLESICASCDVIKECLKSDHTFDKYFTDEEFETSNWPCEKCLEVLKSIKMFWSIIMEKIFSVNASKCHNTNSEQNIQASSVQSVVKVWEKEMVKQALLVKNIRSVIKEDDENDIKDQKQKESTVTTKINQKFNKGTDTFNLSNLNNRRRSDLFARQRNLNRWTSVRTKTVEVGCDTCNIDMENNEITVYKHNLKILQDKFVAQEGEVEKLKRENKSLKLELESFYNSCSCRYKSYEVSNKTCKDHSLTGVPIPFENYAESTQKNDIENIDSEMIITMKNCANKSYKHVSLLKVLHKTNAPLNDEIHTLRTTKENPIDVLTRVQNTFGALVRKEMNAATKNKTSSNKSDITASFVRVTTSKSAPSCSTISSQDEF